MTNHPTTTVRITEYDQALSAASLVDRRGGMAVVATLAQEDGWLTFDRITYLASYEVSGHNTRVVFDRSMVRATLTALAEAGAAEHRPATDTWRMKPVAIRAWLTAPWRRDRIKPVALPPGISWDKVKVRKQSYTFRPWRLMVEVESRWWELGPASGSVGFNRRADAQAVLEDVRAQAALNA
jgi:hypothetical protein